MNLKSSPYQSRSYLSSVLAATSKETGFSDALSLPGRGQDLGGKMSKMSNRETPVSLINRKIVEQLLNWTARTERASRLLESRANAIRTLLNSIPSEERLDSILQSCHKCKLTMQAKEGGSCLQPTDDRSRYPGENTFPTPPRSQPSAKFVSRVYGSNPVKTKLKNTSTSSAPTSRVGLEIKTDCLNSKYGAADTVVSDVQSADRVLSEARQLRLNLASSAQQSQVKSFRMDSKLKSSEPNSSILQPMQPKAPSAEDPQTLQDDPLERILRQARLLEKLNPTLDMCKSKEANERSVSTMTMGPKAGAKGAKTYSLHHSRSSTRKAAPASHQLTPTGTERDCAMATSLPGLSAPRVSGSATVSAVQQHEDKIVSQISLFSNGGDADLSAASVPKVTETALACAAGCSNTDFSSDQEALKLVLQRGDAHTGTTYSRDHNPKSESTVAAFSAPRSRLQHRGPPPDQGEQRAVQSGRCATGSQSCATTDTCPWSSRAGHQGEPPTRSIAAASDGAVTASGVQREAVHKGGKGLQERRRKAPQAATSGAGRGNPGERSQGEREERGVAERGAEAAAANGLEEREAWEGFVQALGDEVRCKRRHCA